MNKFPLFLLLIFLISSCHKKEKADVIFYNGKIFTVDKDFSISEALAIGGGKIIGVGSTKEIMDGFDTKEKVDLAGKPVYPGFIDAHCHFYQYATDLNKVNLIGTNSYDEVIRKVSVFSKSNNFSWILGRGWDQNDWEVKEFPTKEILDIPLSLLYCLK